MRRRTAQWVAVSVLGVASLAHAQNATWNGSAAAWNTDNWIWSPTGSSFPNAPTHNASVGVGTVLISAGSDFTVNTFSQTGGSVVGLGRLTVNGAFNLSGGQFISDLLVLGTATFSGGNMISSGTSTTVAAGGSFVFALPGNADAPGRRLLNLGTVTRTAGNLRGGGSAATIWDNQGLWIEAVGSNSVLNSDYGGINPVFNNAAGAVFRKTTASDVGFTGVAFNNAALVDLQAGSLSINAGGTFSDGAEFKTATGALLSLNSSVLLSGTVSFTGTGTSRLFAGTLLGTHAISGTFNWVAGNLNSAGTTTITNGSVLNITANPADLSTRTLVNNGTVNRTAGTLRGGGTGGSTVENNGTWNDSVSGDSQFNSDYGGAGLTFNNNVGGTFNKTTATGTLFNGARFNNSGTLSVQAGAVFLYGGGQSFGGATFAAAGGTTIGFGSYTLAAGTAYTGPGQFRVANGLNSVFGSVGAERFDFAGGTSGGTATFTGATVSWTGGSLNLGGAFTVAPTGSFTISASPADMAGLTLLNTGTITRTFGSLRGGGAGSVVDNRTLWLDAVAGNSQFNNDYGGSGLVFRNAVGATFRKTAGGTVLFQGTPFINDGTVDAVDGNVQFQSGGTASDGSTFNAGPGGTITFNSSYTLAGTVNFTGSGVKRLIGGTLLGTHTLNGDFYWVGGNLNSVGTTTIAENSTLQIDTGTADLATRTLVNNGTINRTGGALRGGGNPGSVIENNALFLDAVAGNSQINSDYGAAALTINNNPGATFRKTSASVTTFVGVIFNNRSLVDVQSGTVTFGSASARGFNGSEFRVAEGSVVNYESPTLNGTVSFTGAGTHNFYSGTLSGNQTIRGKFRWAGGSLSSTFTTVIAPDGTLDMLTGNNDLATHTLVNLGTVNHNAGNVRGGGNPGSIVRNGGVWVEGAGFTTEYNSDFSGALLNLENLSGGEWRLTTAQIVRLRQVSFGNAGLVDIRSGSFEITGGSSFVQSAGRTQLTGGSISGTSIIRFDGGELGGNGSITLPVNMAGGVLTPGASAGLMQIASLQMGPNADYAVEIFGNARGTDYDAINVPGLLQLAGAELSVLVPTVAPAGSAIGVTYNIASYGALSGTFAGMPEGYTFFAGPLELQISYVGNSGKSITLTTLQVIPEPTSLGLLAVGGLALARRRRS